MLHIIVGRDFFVLLQGVVDPKFKFWNYNFGGPVVYMIGSFFKNQKLERELWVEHFYHTNLLAMMHILYAHGSIHHLKERRPVFQGRNNNEIWIIQSSTRMAVKRAFGMLKGRWKILLKKIDMPLRSIPGMVTTCLCLHNLCLIHADEFDMNWARSDEEELKKTFLQNIGDFRDVNLFHVLESDISEIKNI
jgi:hypothetical protein